VWPPAERLAHARRALDDDRARITAPSVCSPGASWQTNPTMAKSGETLDRPRVDRARPAIVGGAEAGEESSSTSSSMQLYRGGRSRWSRCARRTAAYVTTPTSTMRIPIDVVIQIQSLGSPYPCMSDSLPFALVSACRPLGATSSGESTCVCGENTDQAGISGARRGASRLRGGRHAVPSPSMIRLRLTIERGMRHPVLGPVFIVLFALMMVFMCLHGIHDVQHMATEIGLVCLGLVSLLGVLLLIRVGRAAPPPVMLVRQGRAPPALVAPNVQRQLRHPVPLPLRL
jgi:hypothetical protein